ncbi:MAG TPA: hypothetical protein VFM99_02545 [Chitinophagales bacterium]|nr:hypothetical protein [Chitinophagales bacterium]
MLQTKAITFNRFRKFDEAELFNGVYIVVLHACRIPPHVGIIADKHYHSLTIKGQDYNVPIQALIRNIDQRKISSLFIKIKPHTTFSYSYLREHFILNVQQFPRVDRNTATCLSPIKLFFEEIYDVSMKDVHFLFELLPRLEAEKLIEHYSALFVDEQAYQLPVYTQDQLDDEIEIARSEVQRLHESIK